GDWIGVFYDSAATGVLKCGGYGVWSGLSLVFPAYGNDAAPLPQNGFNQGEIFKVKFWRASTNQTFDATVEYAPVGSFNGLITHTNAFADDGISMIRYLSTLARQSIILKNGWNMISSYINPVQPNIEDIMAPVVQSIDIVKNSTGASYIPLLMINGIGNWNTLEGYQVKANQKDTLVIAGQKIDPELNPIALHSGWQIIAYLRDNPMNTDTVFTAIKQHISLVKNNEGKIYAPQFGINEIGNMLPGQGYKVNALSAATLSYRANLREDPVAERKENLMESEMLHFVLDSNLNTGNNATLILLDSIADLVIDSGDEIGIFTPGNVLCGAAKYQQGENLAITVWGDDSSTGGIVEGMKNTEAYTCKIWDSSEQKECTAMVTFISGQNAYQPDAFEVIQNLMLNHPTDTTITEVACDFYILNNELYFLSGVYTQVLTNVAGCDSTITLNLTINATPIVSVNTPTICAGGTAMLTASGAVNYVWSTGETTASIQVEPLASATYEVIGITAGCSSAPVNAQVFVTPLPIITLNSDTICNGQSTTLTASGAGSYLWSTGQTGNVIVVNPNETTTYSVIGTSSGCSASMESTVTVDQVSADLGNNITLQSGDTITLDADCNCSSYLWSTGETTSSISVTEMGIYTVTVTGTFGCTATDDVVVMTTGVNNLENTFGIAVFPNPASDIVFITCQKFPVSLIQVVDNQGRVVLQENETINMGQTRQVNVKTLPSGFYHVILSGNGFRYGISVIKE
ncbi:MAG: T9SS type A sorting domain-containing protein, partial [Saprospiraceae bacterium]|nr:T9SS type A sorting domain-containing protein [Saprospiraceae bacterium]